MYQSMVKVAGAWMGQGGCVDVGKFLHRGASSGAPLRVRVLVHVPADLEGAGKHSTLIDTAADGADATSERIWDMDIPSPKAGNGGGKPAEYRKLCRPSPKNCREKYCDKENYGSMSSVVPASRKQVSKIY